MLLFADREGAICRLRDSTHNSLSIPVQNSALIPSSCSSLFQLPMYFLHNPYCHFPCNNYLFTFSTSVFPIKMYVPQSKDNAYFVTIVFPAPYRGTFSAHVGILKYLLNDLIRNWFKGTKRWWWYEGKGKGREVTFIQPCSCSKLYTGHISYFFSFHPHTKPVKQMLSFLLLK